MTMLSSYNFLILCLLDFTEFCLYLYPVPQIHNNTSDFNSFKNITDLLLPNPCRDRNFTASISLKYIFYLLYIIWCFIISGYDLIKVISKEHLFSVHMWCLCFTIGGMSFILSYHNSMLTVFSSSSLQNLAFHSGAQSSYLSTNCILTPYSELTKRLLADSYTSCHSQQFAYRSTATGDTWQRIKVNPLVRYVRNLKWTPIPIGLGFVLIAYQQFRQVKKRESAKIASSCDSSELVAPNLYVSMYTMLPLRATSRFWGWVHHIDLPQTVRKPLLNLFVNTYGCNLKEAVVEDICAYKSLGDFFSRKLKKEVRPIYPGNCLVSPSDGRVLHFGAIENGLIEQVKGITYSLKSFLGLEDLASDSKLTDEQYQKNLLQNKDNILYHCVIYLAPGDYHKFHSPAKWTVSQRRHFHGELLSVSPGIVNWIAGLFNINERVVYTGKWKHGFFSLTAVGATNVGSIRVFFDDTLETNKKRCVKGTYEEKHFDPPVNLSEKGQPFGEFNLGSTIVLIFEAPKNIQFSVREGQKIKFGELLSLCNNESCVPS